MEDETRRGEECTELIPLSVSYIYISLHLYSDESQRGENLSHNVDYFFFSEE